MRPHFAVGPGVLLVPGAQGTGQSAGVEDSLRLRPNEVDVLLGPWPSISGRTLTTERNRLLAAFAILFAVNLILGTTFHFRVPWEKYAGYGGLLLMGAKLIYTYMVYRVSKVLRQPLWMTALYVALAPFAGFELIPLVGLLVGIRMTRGALEKPS